VAFVVCKVVDNCAEDDKSNTGNMFGANNESGAKNGSGAKNRSGAKNGSGAKNKSGMADTNNRGNVAGTRGEQDLRADKTAIDEFKAKTRRGNRQKGRDHSDEPPMVKKLMEEFDGEILE
jgi:hypothetical protein